ncbi:MAG: hypothetical protein M0P16_10390 [Syntrophales bacterium]|nr:hypothetical protein [Syntrophales bacterium]MCK9392855.1 hypothetical protein [Syntrophales bacterium]
MESLSRNRAKNEGDLKALDDLKSYYEIASAHAEDLKRFIPVFEALYISMSDNQQRNADILFRTQRDKMTINKASSK